MALHKLTTLFEKLYDINETVVETLFGIPYILVCEIVDSVRRSHKEKNRKATEKEILAARIESGEVNMAELPHSRLEGDNVFDFHYEEYNGEKYIIGTFVYVETEYNEPIHRFFEEQKEEVDKWERKYGCKILFLNQDDFFKNICYPQERSMLKHGLLYNGDVASWDREYSVHIRPWSYVELDPYNVIPLQGQLSLIAQYMYNNAYSGTRLCIDFNNHTCEDC